MVSRQKATISNLRHTKTVTRGPAPVVVFGDLVRHRDHPGVTFVMPHRAATVGGPQSDLGYSIPLVVVTKDLTVDEVMAAALEVGATYRIKQQMREAVQVWAASADWRQNPHRCPSDWPEGGREDSLA